MSKPYFNLYEKICHPANLWWAQTWQPGGCYSFYRTEAKRISPDLTGLTRVSVNQNLYADVNPRAQVTS